MSAFGVPSIFCLVAALGSPALPRASLCRRRQVAPPSVPSPPPSTWLEWWRSMEGWSVPGNLISSGWDTFHVALHRISLDWSRQPLWGGLQPLLPGCMALLVSPDSPITLFPSWGAHGHGHCHRQATCNRRPMEWVDPLSLPTWAGGSLQLLAGQACPSLTSCRIASQRWPENFLLEMISFFHGRPRNLPKGKYHGPLWTRKR